MSLPRMQPQDGVAWVTGASSGIGEAVALELAARGWTVAITARRLEQLEEIAQRAAGLPGRVVAHAGDVTEMDSMRAVIETIESVHGPIALAFLNAGVAPPTPNGALDVEAFETAFAVNTLGAAKGLAAAMERMKARGRGQIAVNASVVGYGGLPLAAAYGASKAAAIHLCETLKFESDRLGIRLQLVNPGFIDTPMTRRNDFPMPFLLGSKEAGKRVVDGFEKGGFEITFPRRLAWMVKLVNLLPYPAYFWAIGRFIGHYTQRRRS
jgi:NAD(P)-dependent dehydrogenase (short-subunit alcohol dehydrogenase family)